MEPVRSVVEGSRAARRGPATGKSQRGAVTAETVVVLPLLVATTLALVWLLSLAVTQVRVTDAAREVARALAREESRVDSVALGRRAAPAGSRIVVRDRGSTWEVQVEAQVSAVGGLLRSVPGVGVDATAVVAKEAR